jgi:glycosyltransferase involved in cell wall biosynthesis
VKIALIGTRGVPAQYGGFETAAEEIGSRLVERGHSVGVYCRNKGQRLDTHRGMKLINLPAIRHPALETLSHTAIAAVHASTHGFDCAILFNAANSPVLPLLRMPTAVHLDGLEWKRAKWQGAGRRYLKWSERRAVNNADDVIADARAIQTYVRQTYRREARFIPYGAPIVTGADSHYRPASQLQPHRFHLVVARIEPENSVEMIVQAFLRSDAQLPLVVVGDNPYQSAYLARCTTLLRSSTRIEWLGSVWDQAELDWYYANCLTYLHGHTVGGTNPSLLRAMGAGAMVVARDVSFNREVCGDEGSFFSREQEIGESLSLFEARPDQARETGGRLRTRVEQVYRWDDVAAAYEELCQDLIARGRQ